MELFDPQPKFQSYNEDFEVYLDALMKNGLVESGLHRKLGKSPYEIALQPIFDAYASKKLWSMIAEDYLILGYETDNDMDLSQGLVDSGNFAELRRLWRSHFVDVRLWYWRNRNNIAEASTAPDMSENTIEWHEVKKKSIRAFETYRYYVGQLSVERELAWIDEEIVLLEKEEKRKPRLKKPLAGKIDDVAFWAIIHSAVSESEGAVELLNEHVVYLLQDYKLTEIKRFQNNLLDKVEALNQWSVWALAYISQAGCSDDSFLYFRCWLLSQGEDTYNLALADVHNLLPQVPGDGLVMNEELLYAAYEAFEIRSGGRGMEIRERADKPPKGDAWDDEDVLSRYPRIAEYYQMA